MFLVLLIKHSVHTIHAATHMLCIKDFNHFVFAL